MIIATKQITQAGEKGESSNVKGLKSLRAGLEIIDQTTNHFGNQWEIVGNGVPTWLVIEKGSGYKSRVIMTCQGTPEEILEVKKTLHPVKVRMFQMSRAFQVPDEIINQEINMPDGEANLKNVDPIKLKLAQERIATRPESESEVVVAQCLWRLRNPDSSKGDRILLAGFTAPTIVKYIKDNMQYTFVICNAHELDEIIDALTKP